MTRTLIVLHSCLSLTKYLKYLPELKSSLVLLWLWCALFTNIAQLVQISKVFCLHLYITSFSLVTTTVREGGYRKMSNIVLRVKWSISVEDIYYKGVGSSGKR
ncbi:hypothetical protein F5884DRAFT_351006 [Xylogone sp. PMI_703]|nr:hypothetical protein F5884DRAFT_351006 [Xylogone sp. PMI_703]